MTHPFRNHDSLLLEYTTITNRSGSQEHEHAHVEDHYILINILGRHSRYVQAMDLLTGKQWEHRIINDDNHNKDPAGMPLNDLNHIQTVLVDSEQVQVDPSSASTGTQNSTTGSIKKEIWLPCGFQGDEVDVETAIHYARIVDLETLEIRTGPQLPYPGGACVALPMIILKNEPPMICSFAGTNGTHDSGQFMPYTTCYDRRHQKFWFPFGKLPVGLDHGSISYIPKGTCHETDPAKLILLNFRTEAYGVARPEMLGFDIPTNGWTLDELQSGRYGMEEPGQWYLYANIPYATINEDPQDFRLNAPRDASGTVTANKGRNILNFGGVYHPPHKPGKRRSIRFSVVRSFDVCLPDKRWSLVGTNLQFPTYSVQTVASQKLQLAFTCGGILPYGKGRNIPWCTVNRFANSNYTMENRHASPAMTGYSNDFWRDN